MVRVAKLEIAMPESPEAMAACLVAFEVVVERQKDRQPGRQHEDFGPASAKHHRVTEERCDHQ